MSNRDDLIAIWLKMAIGSLENAITNSTEVFIAYREKNDVYFLDALARRDGWLRQFDRDLDVLSSLIQGEQ